MLVWVYSSSFNIWIKLKVFFFTEVNYTCFKNNKCIHEVVLDADIVAIIYAYILEYINNIFTVIF